ncbi:MAG: PDZ domain-containing protein [Calditrichaeota bacterium]|nr:MAG: PDZ domain-containing protein [Calditrichota bacterium]
MTKVDNSRLPKRNSGQSGLSISLFVLTGIVFTVFGMLITANLDVTPPINAQIPTNIAETGAYPVVERNGVVESPFVSIVENLSDAVVHISSKSKVAETPWWHRGSNFATSSGSGFFFRDDGYILTNNHVVENSVDISVLTSSGFTYDATLVGTDPQTDLAVIKIEPDKEVTVIPFGDSDDLKVGDWAIAIGNPFPQQGLDRTVTVGVISAKGRRNLRFGSETPAYQDYIQTDAAINPGNSGGPLLNIRGEVIGVNSAISSPSGGSVGIGFAIPINLVRSVVPDLIAHGKVSRGWLGVWLGQLTEQEARRQGIDGVHGVKIDSVFQNSPADVAGIKGGDIILKIAGQNVENNNHLSVLVSQVKDGQPVPMELIRNGEHKTVNAVVADRETFLATLQQSTGNTLTDEPGVRWLGMDLVTFTEDLATRMNIDHFNGVMVQSVRSGSSADNSGIVLGTIIIQINNQPVASTDDIIAISQEMSSRTTRIPLLVVGPDGKVARVVLRP